jgi:hypothetical protein
MSITAWGIGGLGWPGWRNRSVQAGLRGLTSLPSRPYFALADGVSKEGMVSREQFLQWIQASARHATLKPIAIAMEACPNGRDKTRTAGLKTDAAMANAAVAVYRVPVSFWWDSSI